MLENHIAMMEELAHRLSRCVLDYLKINTKVKRCITASPPPIQLFGATSPPMAKMIGGTCFTK
jgi:hypothetical protein